MEFAKAHPLAEEGLAAIEDALWRIDTAREHLIAVCCMTLGVITIFPKKIRKTDAVARGVVFDPDPKRLGHRLVELGRSLPVARELNDRLIALAEHPANVLRNQLTHELAPLDAAPELEWIEVHEIDQQKRVLAQVSMFIWPEGMTDRKDIRDKTLWDYGVDAAKSAEMELTAVTEVATQVITAAGQLEYPQIVYLDSATREVRLQP